MPPQHGAMIRTGRQRTALGAGRQRTALGSGRQHTALGAGRQRTSVGVQGGSVQRLVQGGSVQHPVYARSIQHMVQGISVSELPCQLSLVSGTCSVGQEPALRPSFILLRLALLGCIVSCDPHGKRARRTCPAAAAAWAGVRPCMSCSSMSAPCCARSVSTATCPGFLPHMRGASKIANDTSILILPLSWVHHNGSLDTWSNCRKAMFFSNNQMGGAHAGVACTCKAAANVFTRFQFVHSRVRRAPRCAPRPRRAYSPRRDGAHLSQRAMR